LYRNWYQNKHKDEGERAESVNQSGRNGEDAEEQANKVGPAPSDLVGVQWAQRLKLQMSDRTRGGENAATRRILQITRKEQLAIAGSGPHLASTANSSRVA
jgi:hypothetical protein